MNSLGRKLSFLYTGVSVLQKWGRGLRAYEPCKRIKISYEARSKEAKHAFYKYKNNKFLICIAIATHGVHFLFIEEELKQKNNTYYVNFFTCNLIH